MNLVKKLDEIPLIIMILAFKWLISLALSVSNYITTKLDSQICRITIIILSIGEGKLEIVNVMFFDREIL